MAVAEYGLPFPRVSDDELEQWLVAEAVMARYHVDRDEREKLYQRRQDARQKAAAWTLEQKRGKG